MKNIMKIVKSFLVLVLFLTMLMPSNSIQANEVTESRENSILNNIFNKSDLDNWLKALTYNGSKLSNETNYANMFTTHKIDVTNGESITWGKFGKDEYVLEVYDESDKFIRRVFSTDIDIEEGTTTVTGVANKQYTEAIASYTIEDEKSAYVRILGNISTMNTFMVFKNLPEGIANWPSNYVPYQQSSDQENPLLQKSALFVGDSITNAVKDPEHPYYGWAGRIGTNNDMDWKNAGISSATISTALSSSNPENRVVTQLKENKEKNYEYVILHGGMNDSIAERELGTISDSFALKDFEINTYSGAMEELIYTATKEYENAHIGFIINYATPNSTWGGLSNNNAAYYNRTKEICDKWNIPYIDLFEGGVTENDVYRSYSTDILKVNTGENFYNNLSTEIHIGSKGYDVISPYIADWMKTIKVYEPLKSKTSLDFDSSKQSHVQFNSAFTEIPKTTELWIKADAGNTNRQILIGNYVYQKNCFALELTTNKELRYVEYAYEAGKTVTEIDIKVNNAEVTSGEWMLLSLVRNVEENKITILKNGVVINETQLDGTGTKILKEQVLLDTPHYLGTDARKQSYLDAEISQVRLWGQTKSNDEIKAGMNAEIQGTEDGLQHAYNLDVNALNATNTIIKDLKINGVNGTANGFDLPEAPVYQKDGLDFSKNDKDLETTSLLEEIPMTFETWVKIDSDKAGKRSVIAGNYFDAYAAGIPLMNLEITAKGEPRLYWNINKVATDYIAKGVNVYNGAWTHIAISCSVDPKNANNMIFSTYINGEAVHTQTLDFTPVSLIQPTKIGEDTRFAHYLKGSMADLRIWSTARTADEIKSNFNTEIAADAEGLLGNWLFNEEIDGNYVDRSSNKNDVTSYWIDGDLMKKAADGYESIAIIPDTQTLTYWAPQSYTTLTTWLKDHTEELGIKMAIHVGDIVNDNGYQSQWDNAVNSMKVLDGVLPFVFSPGNHDTAIQKVDDVWWGTRDTAMMNKNFPYSKYSQQETFGGAYEEGAMDNTYSFFTVNNVEFMTISLEQNAKDEVLEWANQIATDNKDKKIIVSTHEYMNYDGNTTTEATEGHLKFIGGSNSGSQVWDKFVKKHENIITVVSGHIGFPDLIMNEATGEHGNIVQQILCDAQFMDRDDVNDGSKDGLGMIMLMSFDEDSEDIHVNWYSTVREQYFRKNNQFTSTMDWQEEPESIDKTDLKSAIDKAKVIMESDQFEYLAENVRILITKRYDEAVLVYNDDKASLEQCMEAWENLAKAIQFADFTANKDDLKKLIDECDAIDVSKYKDGVSVFKKALENAHIVYDDKNSLQYRINQATSTLLTAKNGLKEKPIITINKKALESVIATVQTVVDNQDKYQKNGNWDEMMEAFEEAKTWMIKTDATQKEVNAATTRLSNAFLDIRLIPDEKLLAQIEEFINVASSINRLLYSKSNLKLMDEAIKEANQMIKDKDFSKTEFETFSKKMNEILQIIEHEKLASEVPNTDKKDPIENEDPTPPKTGDTANTAGALLALALSAGIVMNVTKKKKSKSV